MAKGMNMEQFREALSSEATIENEKLKEELEKLKTKSSTQIKELEEELEEYKNWCIQLSNRCYVFSKGNPQLCLYCQIDCCKYRFTEKEMNAAVKMMTKNKMPINEKTAVITNNFLIKRREERLKTKKEEV